jgi:hypothetical protein
VEAYASAGLRMYNVCITIVTDLQDYECKQLKISAQNTLTSPRPCISRKHTCNIMAPNKSDGVRIIQPNISAAKLLYYRVRFRWDEGSGTGNCDSYCELAHHTTSSYQVINGGGGNHSTPRIEVNTRDTIEACELRSPPAVTRGKCHL